MEKSCNFSELRQQKAMVADKWVKRSANRRAIIFAIVRAERGEAGCPTVKELTKKYNKREAED